jgi:glycosyltransferase involved in cell wall biosynthesis
MDSPIGITVILCTYNRAGTLAMTLESIVTQTLSSSPGWEILVVDNNSSDETRQVVEGFGSRYPGRFRYLLETHQGVSYARNAGIREARGEILAFIDDDETAAAGWLQNLTANLHTGEWAGVGGRVLPPPSFSRPRWLSSKHSFLAGPLAEFAPDLEAGDMTETPFGANMAFRKEVFDKYGGFRTDLGRSGKNLLSNEDTEFGRRLMAAGQRLRYEPSALTYHPVEEYRLRKEYFLTWWFNKGRSDVLESGNQPNRTHFLGIPLRLFRDLPLEAVRWMVAVEPSQRFICKLKVWAYAGQGFESHCQWLDARRKRPERDANSWPPAEGGR